ncbi:MAG: hypothetical protein D4R64_04785 [Porphyromonadaceae bacterium]|nr:MAG: hypothetical protein D4R64_04785 [Porphyromonadaceae bacterium]
MSFKFIAAGILFMFASGFRVQGQFLKKFFNEIEFIGGVGTTNYFGDIGGKDPDILGVRVFFDNLDIDLWQTRMALVTGVRFARNKNFSFSMQLTPMLLSGSDERSKYAKEGRHYSFTTSLAELSFLGEYYFANRMTGFSPYGFAGAGGLAYSVYYTKNTLAPDPKRTRWYLGNTVIIGLGARFPSKSNVVHTLDCGFHFSTTDFLDGFKTPRNSKDLFFEISYKINYQMYDSWFLDHKGLVR